MKIHAAKPASIRRINKSIILNLIRYHQPISRIALSKHTGIFRSNVSDIVNELIMEGLVREERSVPKGRGRVPVSLYLRADSLRVAGISIRPTRTSVAVAGLTGRIESKLDFKTPRTPKVFIQEVLAALDELRGKRDGRSRRRFHKLGVSVPGLVDAATGNISWLPALPGYSAFPLARELERQTGIAALVENDCNLGALAELWLGQKEIAGLKDFVFAEIGDVGVGGGIILNRQLYAGHDSSWVAEFGHMVIDAAGPKCPCGRHGCWELYVCDRATWHRYRPEVPFTASSFERLVELARGGDRHALKAVTETARYLAIGLSNIMCSLNPERIVLAGQITRLWHVIRTEVEGAFASSRIALNVQPARLEPEQLFLHGAIHLALSSIFSKPKLGLD